MMTDISVAAQEQTDTGWKFQVELEDEKNTSKHTVLLDTDFWEVFAQRYESPEQLIVRSFEFLLKREPKEAILSEFDLAVIGQYFPEYEEEM